MLSQGCSRGHQWLRACCCSLALPVCGKCGLKWVSWNCCGGLWNAAAKGRRGRLAGEVNTRYEWWAYALFFSVITLYCRWKISPGLIWTMSYLESRSQKTPSQRGRKVLYPFILRIQCTASQKPGCFPMHYPVQFEMTRAVNQHFPWQLVRVFSPPVRLIFPVSLFQLITSFCLAEGKCASPLNSPQQSELQSCTINPWSTALLVHPAACCRREWMIDIGHKCLQC